MKAMMEAEYLERTRAIYARMGRRGRTRMLSEFCELWGYHRKHATRLLSGRTTTRRKGGAGRPAIYGDEARHVLKDLWLATGQLCSKRLKAALAIWLAPYEARRGAIDPGVRRQVLTMSASTIDRLLRPDRVQARRRGLCATRPGSLLRSQVAVRTGPWEVDRPGWIEADTVSHGGASTRGDYIWSVTFTDIYSGWTVMGAVWNRGGEAVLEVVKEVERELVFPIVGFDCDNGGEFLNHHLCAYFADRRRPVTFTRSRAHHSNDNAHVEQKQWTHVRQLVGYDRLDDPQLVAILRALYRPWALLNNFFHPSVKLAEKERDGARVRRRYEPAITPCQRLLGCPHLGKAEKAKLRKLSRSLNPFDLKAGVEEQLRKLAVWKKARIEEISLGALPPDPRSLSLSRSSDDQKAKTKRPSPKPSLHTPSARPPQRRSGRSPALPYPPRGTKSA